MKTLPFPTRSVGKVPEGRMGSGRGVSHRETTSAPLRPLRGHLPNVVGEDYETNAFAAASKAANAVSMSRSSWASET